MTFVPTADQCSLALFRSPYDELIPCDRSTLATLLDVDAWKGMAIIWHMRGDIAQMPYFETLRLKPLGLPLIVVLPPPTEIPQTVSILPLVRHLMPRMILPFGVIDTPLHVRQVMSTPPRSVASALTDYLTRRGLLRSRKAIREFQRIVELAPETRSISALSRRLYTSRRTIGRHFDAAGMPVPSHCLHFARLFHISIQLQLDDSAIFRIASRYGYTDGFTMSNQMKRLIGYRPTEVRQHIGWEWVVEAWLKREGEKTPPRVKTPEGAVSGPSRA